MATDLTFVQIALNANNSNSGRRGAGIDLKDRAKIRSLAATTTHGRSESSRRSRNVAHKAKFKMEKRSAAIGKTADFGLQQPSLYSNNGINCPNLDLMPSADVTPYKLSPLLGILPSYDAGAKFSATSPSTESESDESFQESQLAAALAKSFPLKLKTELLDPFWSFPIPFRPWLSAAIHYRTSDLCPAGVPGLDKSGENTMLELFARNKDVAAYLFSVTLVGAAALRQRQLKYGVSDSRDTISAADIVWLRGCAISAINQHLRDLKDENIESCIGAVTSMAFYESDFGDRDLCWAHITGCTSIIKLAGGMRGLSPVLRKLLNFVAGISGPDLANVYLEPQTEAEWTAWGSNVVHGRYVWAVKLGKQKV